jgi:hypothetical protein
MRRNKRVNDNDQYVIVHVDDMDTQLIITTLGDTDDMLIEIKSTSGATSFKLNSEALDFITSLNTKSKRH